MLLIYNDIVLILVLRSTYVLLVGGVDWPEESAWWPSG